MLAVSRLFLAVVRSTMYVELLLPVATCTVHPIFGDQSTLKPGTAVIAVYLLPPISLVKEAVVTGGASTRMVLGLAGEFISR